MSFCNNGCTRVNIRTVNIYVSVTPINKRRQCACMIKQG